MQPSLVFGHLADLYLTVDFRILFPSCCQIVDFMPIVLPLGYLLSPSFAEDVAHEIFFVLFFCIPDTLPAFQKLK